MFQLNQVLLYISIDRKMVRVTCLSPNEKLLLLLFSFGHLEFLIFNLRTAILLLGTIFGQTYKATNKIYN